MVVKFLLRTSVLHFASFSFGPFTCGVGIFLLVLLVN